jgi:radical SAM protein with 4Fe4S-binding SPASM domain
MKEKIKTGSNRNIKKITAHSDLDQNLTTKGKLRSLWIEIPSHCHLYCDYCFANSNRKAENNQNQNNLKEVDYIKILEDFKKAGGKYLGIPGKGEPFHPKNRKLVKKIIEKADALNIETTIFTSGDALFYEISDYNMYETIVSDKPNYELLDFLYSKKVKLLIKYNSQKPDIQDYLVSTNGYTEARRKALEILMGKPYELNKKKRLGIVTSIMDANRDEIVDLYSFAKKNNLIFDCDTVLPRGRGKKFLDKSCTLNENEYYAIFNYIYKMEKTDDRPGGTYVGLSCNRIFHHLYIDIEGNVLPCIGCTNTRHKDLILGNIKDESLKSLWENSNRTDLKNNYKSVFTGVCTLCENFIDNKCYSCLGRAVKDFTTSGDDFYINTIGCINHRPKDFNIWIIKAVDYLRQTLSNEEIKKLIEDEDFENLWLPNRNLSFYLSEFNNHKESKDTTKEIENISNITDGGVYSNSNYQFILDRIKSFSFKKDYTFSELEFFPNQIWGFLYNIFHEFQSFSSDKQNILYKLFSAEILSNIFIPSLKLYLLKFDAPYEDSCNIQFINMMFFDPLHNNYFYRTLSSGKLDPKILPHKSEFEKETENNENDQRLQSLTNYRKILIIQRWAENFPNKNNYILNHISDLSSILREKIYSDYELILNMEESQDFFDSENNIIINVSSLFDYEFINNKIEILNEILETYTHNSDWKRFSQISSNIFKYDEPNGLSESYINLGEKVYYKDIIHIFKDPEIQLNCIIKKLIKDNLNLDDWIMIKEDIESADNFKEIIVILNNTMNPSDQQHINKKYNATFIEFLSLFAYDEKSDINFKIINYFIWLGYLQKYLGINTYYVSHSQNFSYTNIDEDTNKKSVNPSGIIICSKKRLSMIQKSNMKLLFNSLMQPFDEIFNLKIFNNLIREKEKKEIFFDVAHEFKNNININRIKSNYDALICFLEDKNNYDKWEIYLKEKGINLPLEPEKDDYLGFLYILTYIASYTTKKLSNEPFGKETNLKSYLKSDNFHDFVLIQPKIKSPAIKRYEVFWDSIVSEIFRVFIIDGNLKIKNDDENNWSIRYKQIIFLIILFGNSIKHFLDFLLSIDYLLFKNNINIFNVIIDLFNTEANIPNFFKFEIDSKYILIRNLSYISEEEAKQMFSDESYGTGVIIKNILSDLIKILNLEVSSINDIVKSERISLNQEFSTLLVNNNFPNVSNIVSYEVKINLSFFN